MRVAVVTQYFPTSRQPWAGHSAYQTLRVLSQKCDLKVFYPEAVYPSFLAPKSWLGPLDRTWQPADVLVEYIPYLVLPAVSRPLNGAMMARKLGGPLLKFQPDIILNYVVYPDGWAAVLLGRDLQVPVVLTAIGSDLNRISDPLCGVFTRKALRGADRVITVSGDLKKTAVKMGSAQQRTHAILNGCDTEIFHPRDRLAARRDLQLNPTSQIVVYIGRTDVRKGLVELVDAFSQTHQKLGHAELFLVGDGPDKPLLEEKIAHSRAADSIHLLPSCSTSGVAQWMGAADLVVLPSYAEGCPNVVIEALCSGRPVVASSVGGIPELMDDSSGRLIPPKSAPALEEALSSVLMQPWDAQSIAAKHKRSWSDVADDVLAVLIKAAQGATSS